MPRSNQELKEKFVQQCSLLACFLLSACSSLEPPKQVTTVVPVLEVKEGPYTFSMFPEYENDKKSKLKLDIRDSKDSFIRASKITAVLIGKDGDEQVARFVEDQTMQRYIAEIPLRHHEEYLIQTELVIPDDSGRYTPVFSFHCCDPLPVVLQENAHPAKGAAK